jgi:hypothetical protein
MGRTAESLHLRALPTTDDPRTERTVMIEVRIHIQQYPNGALNVQFSSEDQTERPDVTPIEQLFHDVLRHRVVALMQEGAHGGILWRKDGPHPTRSEESK